MGISVAELWAHSHSSVALPVEEVRQECLAMMGNQPILFVTEEGAIPASAQQLRAAIEVAGYHDLCAFVERGELPHDGGVYKKGVRE